MAPDGRSSLEVFRNYEKALAEAGFTTLFTCAKESCGRDGRLGYVLFGSKPMPAKTAQGAGLLVNDAFTGSSDERLLVAVREDGPRQTYVQLLVAKSFGFEARGRKEAGPAVLLEVVEIGAMEERMVTVDAAAMAKGIAETGSIALYGIYFDTDKAVVKPESAETISEIAKLLKAEPGLELYVVGHTDNQGTLDYNLGLSKRRAQAVVEELVKKHGIAASRLAPAGVAMLAPKAPNEGEEGRAKNRRVELVRQQASAGRRRAAGRSGEEGHHELALVRGGAHLPEEDPLPGTEQEPAAGEGDGELAADQDASAVRRHVVGPFDGVGVGRIAIGRPAPRQALEVGADVRVGVLGDHERGTRVAKKEVGESVRVAGELGQRRGDRPGDVEKLPPVRAEAEMAAVDQDGPPRRAAGAGCEPGAGRRSSEASRSRSRFWASLVETSTRQRSPARPAYSRPLSSCPVETWHSNQPSRPRIGLNLRCSSTPAWSSPSTR